MTPSPDAVKDPSSASHFAEQARERSPGIVREFADFLMQSKKWWLAPIVIVLLLVGVVIVLGSTSAAPFIYTLF
jgi:hypothetical protein